MQQNVGSVDRTIRIVAGLVLIALVFVGPQTPWGWIGIIPLATAFMSWCPLYSLLGMRTSAADEPVATEPAPSEPEPTAPVEAVAPEPEASESAQPESDENKPL